jgi:hypothetical protein
MIAVHPTSTEWYLDPTVPVPLRNRIMWSPITALICFAGMVAADVALGFTVARLAGLAIGAVWLGLAIHNRRSGGAFLRGLYAPSDERVPSAHVVDR